MTRDKNLLFNIFISILFSITVPSLSALNETRIDVYLNIFILEYFIGTILLRPRRRSRDYVSFALLILFLATVAFRVLEVFR